MGSTRQKGWQPVQSPEHMPEAPIETEPGGIRLKIVRRKMEV